MRYRKMKQLFFGIFLIAVSGLCADVIPLPELSRPETWSVENSKPGLVDAGNDGEWLSLKINGMTQENTCRLMLKKPIDVPQKSELVWNGAVRDHNGFFLHVLVRDSRGGLYRFNQSSRSYCKNSMYLGAYFEGGMDRAGEVLFRTYGLPDFENQSFSAVKPAWGKPVPPLKLTGLELSSEGGRLRKTTLWFRNFRFHDRSYKNSSLYYQFDNLEQYGEVSGLPGLSYGDIVSWNRGADRYVVDWSVRSSYEGQPFLTGTGKLEIDQKTGALPRELQFTKRIEFPVKSAGTYWIRVKCRSSKKENVNQITEKDYRLYVIRGETAPLPSVIGRDAGIGSSAIRIAPERPGFVWGEEEPWILNVRFRQAENTKGVIEIRDAADSVLLKKEYLFTKPEETVTLTLSALKPGIVHVAASQFKNGKLLDRSVETLGKKREMKPEAFRVPQGIPSAKELIEDEKPHFYFDPQISVHGPDDAEKIKKSMEAVKPITKDFEIPVSWSEIERLPGAYDFSRAEALLEHAEKLGMRIQFRIGFSAPEWVPSHFTQNPEGAIFGHNTYLFHGARLNTYHSPVIRDASLRFLKKLVLHFRNFPALQSYYILVEHPNEAPYKGWYEGFDEFTLSSFRRAMLKRYGSLEHLNRTWKTGFKTEDSVMPPYPKANASNQLWLDWIAWRESRVSGYMDECVDLIRSLDPHRMIMMYSSGSRMRGKGVMTANGGCHEPEKSALGMMRAVDRGLPQRAEEHSVGRWRAYFPTQLDASVFSMMMGGGENSFCKMFFPVQVYLKRNSLDDLRNNAVALDRFEKFMPIWTELRPARTVADDIRYFADANADRLSRKSTFHGGGSPWNTMLFLDSQVPFWIAPGRNWKQAKLVVLPAGQLGILERRVIDELADYVKNGGNILMSAAAGRGCVEDDGADWVLLKRFGFSPPRKFLPGRQSDLYRTVNGREERLSPAVSGHWAGEGANGTLIACRKDRNQNVPAVTMRSYGKGKVFVFWSVSTHPAGENQKSAVPLLRLVAEQCGADLPFASTSRYTWLNLLKHKDREIWYLLVMRSGRGGTNAEKEVVTVSLPDGAYRMSELINGNGKTTETTAQKLRSAGIPVNLKRLEVAIFKLERK